MGDDLVQEFRRESAERLDQVEQSLLGVERGDADAVARAFRALHTIKGNASFVDFIAVNRLAHELESLLDAVRTGNAAPGPALVDILLQGVDRLRRLLPAAADGGGIAVDDLVQRVRAARPAAGAAPSPAVPAADPSAPPAPPPRTDRRPRLGEWLIAHGELPAAAVARALVAQERSGRHPIEILLHEAGCPPDEALALAAEAEEAGLHPFALAPRRPGLAGWTADRLHGRLQVSRPPLGRILTDLGIVSTARMRDLLAAYFAGEAPPLRTPAPAPAPRGDGSFPEPVAVEIGDDLRGELRDMTDATARSRIEEGLLAVRAEGPAIADLDRLYRELHSLKGTFGFLGAALTQRVLHEIEDAIGLCKRRAADLSGTDRDPLVDALLAGIDHVWRLRDACLARGDEAAAGVAPLLPAWKAGLDTACHALAAAMDARSAGHDITSEF